MWALRVMEEVCGGRYRDIGDMDICSNGDMLELQTDAPIPLHLAPKSTLATECRFSNSFRNPEKTSAPIGAWK